MSAPAVASASAIACPMPLEAPVTTAQRPVRSKGEDEVTGVAGSCRRRAADATSGRTPIQRGARGVTLPRVRLGVAAAVVDGLLVRGDVEVDDGRIAAVGLSGGRSGLAVPGLVDLQVNGYGGIDVLQATSDEILALGVELARTGVLWYQPTLVTRSCRADAARARHDRRVERRARRRILGAHLEGPFLASGAGGRTSRGSTCASPISISSPRSSSRGAPSPWSRSRRSSPVRAS